MRLRERALYTKEAPVAEHVTDSADLASRSEIADELKSFEPVTPQILQHADFATRRDVADKLEPKGRPYELDNWITKLCKAP